MLLKKFDDGNEIPMIGLGTWQQTDEITCTKAIKEAYEIGYRHIDTADIYENHEFVGKAIKTLPREKLFITTKLWRDFMDPKLVESEVDKCLMQLDLDYLDLYLIHWPDRTKPMADILYEMIKQKEKGKIKSVGVSNFTVNHLQDLLDQKLKFEVNQVEYHPFLNQEGLLHFCNRHAIALTAYSPIARGEVNDDPDLKSLAIKHKKTPSQIALNWLIQKDIIVIPKSSSKKHLKENFEIFNFHLEPDEIKLIDKISQIRRKRIINPDFADFEY